jgi:hypothetical protein
MRLFIHPSLRMHLLFSMSAQRRHSRSERLTMSRTPGAKNVTLDLTALSFVDEDVPAITRTSKENPLSALVAPLAVAFLADPDIAQKAKGFDVPSENVESVLRLLGNAGRENGVTIRKSVHYGDTNAHISFWLAPIQHRPRANVVGSLPV